MSTQTTLSHLLPPWSRTTAPGWFQNRRTTCHFIALHFENEPIDEIHDNCNNDNNGNENEPEEPPVQEEPPVLRRSGRIAAANKQKNPEIGLRRSPRLALKKRVNYCC
jgi:hypothetical protein